MSNYLDKIIEEFITGPSSFKPVQSHALDPLPPMGVGQVPPMGVGQVPSGMQQQQIVGGQPGPMGQVGQAVGMGGNAGDLLGATAAYQNTQNRRMRGVGGMMGNMANFGEAISDAIREPEARRQLKIETDLAAAQQQTEKNRQEMLVAQKKKERADSVFEMTGDKNLARLAYEDEQVGREIVKAQMKQFDPSTMQKEWEFIQSQPEGPQKQMLLEKFMKQKETIMKMPLEFGYMYDKNGNIQYAPGEDNPARLKAEKEQMEYQEQRYQAKVAQGNEIEKMDNSIRQIEKSLDKVSPWSAGYGSLTKILPNTPAYELSAMLDTQRATVAFRELKDMREASKTGGALGNVSNREIQLLHRSYAAMDEGMSPELLRSNLNDVLMGYEGMKYGLENENKFQMMVADGEMTMDEALAQMQSEKKAHINQSMANRWAMASKDPEAKRKIETALQRLQEKPESIHVFEKTYGWRPRM